MHVSILRESALSALGESALSADQDGAQFAEIAPVIITSFTLNRRELRVKHSPLFTG